jgi:TetR/AcrR family transcriptional regulator, regulator of cefoperazone and chloramphenicol sensitivity
MTIADDCRIRLLATAGEVFAEKGFEGATVREICKRAKANIAAINYYFRDKERLYIEAVKQAACGLPEAQTRSWPPGTPPAQKLRTFIRVMVSHLLDRDKPVWHSRLMMHELAQPTAACAELVRDYIAPTAAVLMEILGELLPPNTPRWKQFMTGFSIVSQCLYYVQNKPIAQLLVGEEEFREFDEERLAEHIAQFSLAALSSPTFLGEPGALATGGGNPPFANVPGSPKS